MTTETRRNDTKELMDWVFRKKKEQRQLLAELKVSGL